MSGIVGIDLGTTFSAVGWMSADGPQLIPNALGEVLTPSVVGIDDGGRVLVGRAAKELQVNCPDRCVSLFKRYMGTDWTASLARKQFKPEELSSLVLTSLKQDAEAFLKQPVERAVITVPAYFNEHQRKATLRAGKIAGFHVERILNEPTAAAIAYGLHDAQDDKVLVVFDLGGGTFDVSIVELFEGTLEVRASSGETFLGGEDFTSTLAARVLELQGHVFEHLETREPLRVSRMRQECEQAKRRLSRQPQTDIRIPNTQGEFGESPQLVTVTRAQFDTWTEFILNRIELPIRRALGDAGLKRDDVQELILVGGATRMPSVARRIELLFGRTPTCRLNPDEVVALGASVQAGLIDRHVSLEELVVTDVAPFTLGVEVSREFSGERRDGYFLPIINRNTTIPVSRVRQVSTLQANQTVISVKVYQGEARRVSENLLLGEFDAEGIPPGPAGRSVDIRFTYDLNGVLEVEATIVDTGRKVNHIITRHAQGMSESQVAAAVRALQKLKFHPREDAANRLLLRRAERLYRELPLQERRWLEQLLDGFEGALEMQDKAAIDSNREALEEMVNRYDGEFLDEQDRDDDPGE